MASLNAKLEAFFELYKSNKPSVQIIGMPNGCDTDASSFQDIQGDSWPQSYSRNFRMPRDPDALQTLVRKLQKIDSNIRDRPRWLAKSVRWDWKMFALLRSSAIQKAAIQKDIE